MDRNFGGVIWTNHALERLRQRGISQGDAWATFNRPDQTRKAASSGGFVYYKTYPSTGSGLAQKIEVVAKEQDKKWIILSVWSRPVYGNHDYRKVSSGGMLEKILQFLLGWARKK